MKYNTCGAEKTIIKIWRSALAIRFQICYNNGMNAVKVNAYAKLNLTLDVTGRENGYHTLDSLVTTISLSDRIVVKKRRDQLVNIVMHGMGSEGIYPERNNAYLAGEAFVKRFGTTGADIAVYKNIPIGAGLGGSSADAAGVLNAMAKLYAIADMGGLKSLADGLGSDTGYLLRGGAARMRGRGENLRPVGGMPEMHFLLLVPEGGVSTAECFRRYDELGKAGGARTERVIGLMSAGNAVWAANSFGNDLYEAAVSLEPRVRDALTEAKSFSPLGAGMTGSGSAVFALFETRELAEWARSRYRGKARALCVKSMDGRGMKGAKNPFVLSDEEQGL